MFSRFGYIAFRLRQIQHAPWFLPLLFAMVAVVTIIVAYVAARFAPQDLPFTIDHGALQSILTILGSSMLTIAVFSLSTLVGAVSQASQATTPRAVPLIVQDRSAQTPISVFIGAFLYSILGIIGLSSGIYSDAGRLILFFVTLVVVVVVVTALIRWIGHTVRIGRTSETIGLVEHAATKAMEAQAEDPRFGCRVRRGAVPDGQPVRATKSGYLQHFDLDGLHDLTKDRELTIHLLVWPGAWVLKDMELAVLVGAIDDKDGDAVRKGFTIGTDRTFEFDPRYGITTLAEIGNRALSPAVNDPGTALDVIGALVRVLASAPEALAGGDDDPRYPQLTLPPLVPAQYFSVAFRTIGRDGADKIEIVLRLARGLIWLSRVDIYRDAAEAMLSELRERALGALPFEGDRKRLDEKIAAYRDSYWAESSMPSSEISGSR